MKRVVLDVRWTLTGPSARELYEAGHIPGARYVDLETELAAPPRPDGAGGRHPLPHVAVFERAMRAHGIDDDSEVLVYGASAARAWWLLRWAGLERVDVLDGGYEGWVAAGNPVETGPPGPVEPGGLVARPGSMPTVDAAGAARVAREGTLIDVRAPERYRGEAEPVDPVAGHIPGAVNGIPDALTEPVAAYCGSGVVAAQAVLDLDRRGISAALYPGSWSDWVSDPTRPVARGS